MRIIATQIEKAGHTPWESLSDWTIRWFPLGAGQKYVMEWRGRGSIEEHFSVERGIVEAELPQASTKNVDIACKSIIAIIGLIWFTVTSSIETLEVADDMGNLPQKCDVKCMISSECTGKYATPSLTLSIHRLIFWILPWFELYTTVVIRNRLNLGKSLLPSFPKAVHCGGNLGTGASSVFLVCMSDA